MHVPARQKPKGDGRVCKPEQGAIAHGLCLGQINACRRKALHKITWLDAGWRWQAALFASGSTQCVDIDAADERWPSHGFAACKSLSGAGVAASFCFGGSEIGPQCRRVRAIQRSFVELPPRRER
jgi:hypothetical protein